MNRLSDYYDNLLHRVSLRVRSRLPGSKYVKGFNVSMGDPDPFFGILQTGKTVTDLCGSCTDIEIEHSVFQATHFPQIQEQSYVDGAWSAEVLLDHPSLVAGDRVREKAKAAGDKDWWKKGWETWTPHLAESQSSFV